MEVFANLLGNYGFPIVACIVMAWYVKYTTDKQAEETKLLNENHTKEMLAFKDEIKVALENNTRAIDKLCDQIERG